VKVAQICVIGGGYVGIPTAAILAKRGHNVVLAENNESRFAILSEGRIPIFEPGLENLIKDAIAQDSLSFSKSAADAVTSFFSVYRHLKVMMGQQI
jgi:UDPglucose 6-dehydrogenase